MGPRNLLILFFSTVAVSLVILVIFFSLFFKNVDLNFNTKLPDSAPQIDGGFGGPDVNISQDSKADGLLRSTVHVPPESREPVLPPGGRLAEEEPADSDLPPVSDDAILDDTAREEGPIEMPGPGIQEKPPAPAMPALPRSADRRPTQRPVSPPPYNPVPVVEPPSVYPEPSGPPVPSQGDGNLESPRGAG